MIDVDVHSETPISYVEVLVANTWECNLRCHYCFVEQHSLNAAGGWMIPDTADRLVEALDHAFPEVENICIHLYGGEPLLNLPAIRTMVQKTANKPEGRFTFSITTNGTVAEPEVFEVLDNGNFYVIVSIDGPQEIHDQCRISRSGSPTHSRVMKFLEILRAQTRCHIWGSSVVRSGWSLAEAHEYLRSLPIDAIKAQAIRTYEGSAFALRPDELRDYFDHLAAVGQTVIEDLEAGRRPRDDRFTSRVLQVLTNKSRKRFCGAGLSNFGVTPDGTVRGCLLLNDTDSLLGHINDDPLTWRLAGKAWANASSPNPKCQECDAMPLCGGGCPAVNPICGDGECEIVRKNCEVAHNIYQHFRNRPEILLGLVRLPSEKDIT